MPPSYFPLKWESTGDQWWFASPIDYAAANGHYDLVRELLYLDTNLLIKLTSLCRIRRLESVWDDEEQFQDVAKCRSQVAQKLLLECETKKGHNSLIRAGYGGWLLYTAASAGDLEFVKGLLEKDPFLVFGEGEYGVTDMLYAAARSKNCEVFKLLLDSAISPRSICNGGVEEKEVQPEEVQSVFKWDMMNRAVHAAARGGDVKMLKELLGECPDVLVYRDALGSTLLHSASGRGQAEVVKFLLASYDVVNTKDRQGNTALHIAAYRGYLSIVQILVDSSPSTALLKNNFGDTFLHMAVAGFKSPGFRRLDRLIELIKQLVCGKVVNMDDIINAKNNDGRTALHMAVIDNIQSELVELLMSARFINLNARDVDGNTPLDLLRHKPKSASSDILIKQLISAGGISKCQDLMSRNALVSHLKLQGIGGSPGTSFRIPDAEIFLYTGIDGAFDAGIDFTSTDYDTCSGELSYSGSSIGSSSQKKKLSSVSNAARRLKMLLHLTSKKERQNVQRGLKDDDSIEPYDLEDEDSIEPYPRVGKTPIPLRHKFSTPPALPNNKRVLALPHSLPSPSTKKKYASKLMQGVLQVKRQLSFASPSSTLSESSWSSPTSVDRGKRLDLGSKSTGLLGSILSPSRNKMKSFSHKQGSFNIRLMNQCFSFGAQGLANGSPNNIALKETGKT